MTEKETIEAINKAVKMTDAEREIRRLISYIRSCREAGIDCTVTIDKSLTHGVINDLEEIQQYRAIDTEIKKIFDGQLGLMDILKEYIEDIKKTHNGEKPRKIIALSNEDADKWESYKKIGTVEECRNAVEKQKSKKVFIIAASKIVCKGSYVFYKCPVCREQICSGFYYPPLDTYLGEKQYCENCGQAIDWSEEE